MEELMNLIEVIKIPKYMSIEKFNDQFGDKNLQKTSRTRASKFPLPSVADLL
jgi:hypothetical protein